MKFGSSRLQEPSLLLMPTMLSAVAVFLALSTSVSAHTIFQELYVDGVSAGHTTGIRVPEYDGVSSLFWFKLLHAS